MAVTLFIPDFKHRFVAAGGPRLPALERLVARAARHETPSVPEFLAPLFGLEPRQLAAAPFMHLADSGVPDGGYRMCADFVHLAPDRDQLVLMPQELLQATPEELTALTAAFNALYSAEGWKLECIQGRAYLRCPRSLDVVTTEPAAVAGQAVLGHMPSGADAALLKQLMNESQMLFHTQAVNRAREDADRPLINSLWLWGGGALPATASTRKPRRVTGDLPLLRGLAAWSGMAADTEGSAGPGDDVVLGSASMDIAAMERDWFAPALAALKRGNLTGLALYLGGMGSFSADPAAARRFWRRPRALVVAGS